MQKLGVSAASVFFLGYPDRRLNTIWQSTWRKDCPVQAPFTRATRSPYPLTFNPQATYCGSDVLGDLGAIIADYRPDLVLLPHPNDEHADRRAAGNFVRLALGFESAANPCCRPAI